MSEPQVFLPRNRRPVPTRTRLATRRLPAVAYAVVLVLLPVLVVGGGMVAGWWATTGRGAITFDGGAVVPRSESGAAAVPQAPADVKGSMTVRQVADAFTPVTVEEILAAFGAPADTPDTTQMKSLVNEDDGDGGMDIPSFRIWLGERLAG